MIVDRTGLTKYLPDDHSEYVYGASGAFMFQKEKHDKLFERYNEIFEDIFSQVFRQQRQPQPPPEARISIAIDLADSIRGGKRIIGVQTPLGTSNVEIDVPKGIVHGENVRYPKAAPGGLDLVVNFRCRPHPQWQRNGMDMHTQIKVDFWTLIIGGDVTVIDILRKKI